MLIFHARAVGCIPEMNTFRNCALGIYFIIAMNNVLKPVPSNNNSQCSRDARIIYPASSRFVPTKKDCSSKSRLSYVKHTFVRPKKNVITIL